MKLSAALVALCALPAAAFVPQMPSTFRTALASDLQTDQAMDQAMMQRLQELEEKERRLTSALKKAESRLSQPSQPVSRGLGRSSMERNMNRNTRANSASPLPVYDVSELFDLAKTTTVQGGSLRTWSFANPNIDFVQVMLKTEGRPLDADIQLWHGPDNTPHKMKVYVEDGGLRTFNALIGTPNGPNTIAIRNTGMLEFPLTAVVEPDRDGQNAALAVESSETTETIQGGALRTYPFESMVDSVAVLLKTDGRPLNARIELLQGPNNNKQVIELYTEDGMNRPFFAIIETPGSGNVVRVVNTAPVEFPMAASVQAYGMNSGEVWGEDGIQMGHAW